MINWIKNKIVNRRKHKEYLKWRSLNSHNDTKLCGPCNMEYVHVGNMSYGILNVLNYSDEYELFIGNFVSIAPEVCFLLCSEHNTNTVSSFPFKVLALNLCTYEALSKGNIIVEDDVWIGYRATILSGVRIGQGAVIAAGAVVNKDVPPYAVVGGAKAKIIKYRFSEDVREYLLTLDYGKLKDDIVSAHIDDLYASIEHKNVDEVRSIFEWFPKK